MQKNFITYFPRSFFAKIFIFVFCFFTFFQADLYAGFLFSPEGDLETDEQRSVLSRDMTPPDRLYKNDNVSYDRMEAQKEFEIIKDKPVIQTDKVEVRPLDRNEAMRQYVKDNFVAQLNQDSNFDRKAFQEVMTEGFKKVYNEFILSISYETIFGYAIEALQYYVPKLTLTRAGGRLLIHRNLELIGTFPLPDDPNKVEPWVEMLTYIFDKCRNFSKDLFNAHMEEVYFVLFTYLLQSIDSNSEYIYPAKVIRMKKGYSVNSSIGITYRRVEDGIQILSLFDNSPALLSGLEEGDLITHLYGELVKDLSDEKIESILYSNEDAIIHIGYISYNTQVFKEVYLRTSKLNSSTVKAVYNKDTKNLTLTIHNFTKGTAYALEQKIEESLKLYDNQIDGYIIDLRGNSGGIVEEALESANLFVNEGIAMLETVGKDDESNKIYRASAGDIAKGKPIVVLADGTTQSAAEFFVAIIQSTGRGIMLGSPTYGKGTIQRNIELPNKSMLSLSVAEAFTGNGNAINRIGVFPVVCTSTILNDKDLDVFKTNVLKDRFHLQYETFVVKKGVVTPPDVIEKLRESCLGVYPNLKYIGFLNKIAETILVQSDLYNALLKKLGE